ncbi:beta-eliminating lyase-related protein [Pendulispora rubella]|uniref:Beta-eliminating lyase-related protein n=1 Tax=Pendulispora rubella TaxID=2741070 RepID=A0ABZ2KZE3_9BACT
MNHPPEIKRSLCLHGPPVRHTPREMLMRLLERMPPDTPGSGPLGPVAQLEERVARLLGKEAALFFPTGTMAQQVALRIHAEQRGRSTFAAHPQCHLAVWEDNGYSVIHGLRFQPAGDPHALLTLEDLSEVKIPLAALVLELPQRDIGGQLPSWASLGEQVAWARERGAAVHMDGARLWEAQTFYERPFSDIAGLFDSVYVSLYKSLRGIRGAVLAGSKELVAEASVWRMRLGGSIPDAWPLAAAALLGLDDVLPRMKGFRDYAITLAAAINRDSGAHTLPEDPQTPLFHVHLPASKRAVEAAADAILAERGIQLFRRVLRSPDERSCRFEITIGENAMDFTPDEVVSLLRELLDRANANDRASRSHGKDAASGCEPIDLRR